MFALSYQKIAAAFGAAFFMLALLQPEPATAQNACMPRDGLLEKLGRKYREKPIAAGLASNGQVVELFSSPGGLTWTLVVTTPTGISCLIASGQAWNSNPANSSPNPPAIQGQEEAS